MPVPPAVVIAPALDDWAVDWDRLVTTSLLPTPFLRSWWLSGVATAHDCYVLVLEGERLLGGLALQRRRVCGVDVFTVLGGGKLCPDHLDLVAAPERIDDVKQAIFDWFVSPGRPRILRLDGLHENAWLTSALGPSARVESLAVAPFEPLTTFEDYLAARSPSFLKRTRKYRRRSEGNGVRYRRATPAECPDALDAFVRMHRAREDRAELARELPRIVRAAERGLTRDEVRLYVAEADGRYGVVMMCFVTGQAIRMYQQSRAVDDATFNHAGIVVDLVAVEDACADGLTEIDFLRGNEPHKASLTSSRRQLVRLSAAHGLRARILLGLSGLAGALRRWVHAVRQRTTG